MRKIFIFMLLCFSCIGIKAQNCSADTVSVNANRQKKALQPADEPVSEMHISLSLRILEEEYDVVCTDISANSFIASRGGRYYLVDILSGKEVEVENDKYEDNYSMIIQ